MNVSSLLLAAALVPAITGAARMVPSPGRGLLFAAYQNDAGPFVGVWTRVRSDAITYQKITLVLRGDGSYTKTLDARVNGATYGGTHEGTWTAKGSVVYLSGDGNWPALSHDLSEFRRGN